MAPPQGTVDAAARGLPPDLATPAPAAFIVHVHAIELDPHDLHWKTLSEVLSLAEQQRAARFAFEVHRRRFVQSHAALRRVIGGHLGVAPAAIEWAEGCHGRPWLGGAEAGLDFNLSHADDRAVIAVSHCGWVGIDIERTDRPIDELVSSVLTKTERRRVDEAPSAQRAVRFFEFWTGKEAFMKLNGTGLHLAPEEIEIEGDAAPDGKPVHRHTARAPQRSDLAVAHACLTSLELFDGYTCTLATPVAPAGIRGAA
jgi:4'-phosphopantetheinyl transferase